MDNHVYQAGIARTDITPPVGIRLFGYAVREGASHTIEAPLTATALALRGADNTVVLLGVDIVAMPVRHAAIVREACAAAAGIPASHVVINCNHTHSSPGVPGFFTHGTPDELATEAAYCELFTQRCAQACREAVAALQPARLAVGWGECKGNINRRQQTPEGGMLMGENPAGPCDHSVGVLRVDDLSGAPIAIAFRYSCHTVTLGPKTNVISPDFIGPARAVVESQLGCPSLFLQGCAGNINPITGIGQDPDSSPTYREDQFRLGHMLGGAVLETAQSLRTHRRRKEPVLVQSVAVYWLYEYESIAPGAAGSIEVRESIMKLPLAPYPPAEEMRRESEEWAAKLAAAQARQAREWEFAPLLRFDHWARLRLDAAGRSEDPVELEFPVQFIRIGSGDAAFNLVALPFETMNETGTALREALGYNTFVLGYSNGIISYLPTPEISNQGGMEAKLGYKNYLLPSELPGTWEPQIRAATLRLSKDIS